MFQGIDLYSDTLTKPSPAMRKAMVEAQVGDEQKGEDPTTLRLEHMVADLLGQSAALFLPTATMANQIAIRTLTRPGDELVAVENAHVLEAETGGPAIHSQVMTKPLKSKDGTFWGEDLRSAFHWGEGPHDPVTRLVVVENTANLDGGTVWPQDQLQSVIETAKSLGMKLHLDGARFFNAAVKSGLSPRQLASGFDTVTICLSKGLGCPIGAVLAFDKSKFAEVRRFKQLMGGALRQSGMLAAAGIYALENNVSRLEEDHINAKLLAQKLMGIPFIELVNPEPSTNMVFFNWTCKTVSANKFDELCLKEGLRFSQTGRDRFRAVTHLDIHRKDIDKAVEIVNRICTSI